LFRNLAEIREAAARSGSTSERALLFIRTSGPTILKVTGKR
jgi:hypothetical protein